MKKIEQMKQKNTHSRKLKRKNLTDKEIEQIKEKDILSRKLKRKNLPNEEIEQIKQKDTLSRKLKRKSLPDEKIEQMKQKNTHSRKQKRKNLPDKEIEQIKQKDALSRKLKRKNLTDKEIEQIKQTNTLSRKLKRKHLPDKDIYQIKQKNSHSRKIKRKTLAADLHEVIKEKDTKSRAAKRKKLNENIDNKFSKSVQEFPIFVCCCCNKTCYRQQVQLMARDKYINTDDNLLNTCLIYKRVDGKQYICQGCHATLIKNKLPAAAVANSLQIDNIPSELQDLRELESVLISQRIIFFKMVNLPRGGQKGMVGSFVNIPVDTEQVCASLPRTPEQSGIIPLKLKRKIAYKGYHLHQNIRPNHVIKALNWLIQNNVMYRNIKVKCDWFHECQEEDEEVWNSLCVTDSDSTGITSGNGTNNGIYWAKENDANSDQMDTRSNTDDSNSDQIQSDRNHDQMDTRPSKNDPNPDQMVTRPNEGDLNHNQMDTIQSENKSNNEQMDTIPSDNDSNHDRIDTIPSENDLHHHQMDTRPSENNQSRNQADTRSCENGSNYDQLDTKQSENYINCNEMDSGPSENDLNNVSGDVNEKARGVQYGTCLHPSTQHMAEKEYSIAPGEGKFPMDPFLDKKCEALSFPHLFPFGRGTWLQDDNSDRLVPLSAKKYFIQRLLNSDSRFASSVPYLFYALNVCEKQQIQSAVTIALRKARRMDITVGELKNPERLQNIFIKDQAFQFLQQVRGSPSYWQRTQYELLSMVRAKGVFTWFLTLSCADLQWPETIQAIAAQHGQILTSEDISQMSYEDKCKWLRRNPVTAARQYDHRLQSFFRDVIQSAAAPLGKVTHFFQRTEFQLRGSPHCHAVIWVENAPDLEKSTDEQICEFFNRYISCDIPPEDDPLYEEVVTKQLHTHSVACRKNQTVCRFHYPKPPSDYNLLSKPDEDANPDLLIHADRVKEILARVNEVLIDDAEKVPTMSVKDVLSAAKVTEHDYYRALKYSKSGKSVVLKRNTNCLNINNYNKDILRIWKANMDLQFVCDPYACITYIASYVTKDERELSQMLKEAAKEMKDADVKARLRKVGNVYLSNRELSAQEAAYRLLSIPLKRSSSKLVWIPTDLPEDRIGILKPQTILDELDDDDTDIYASGIVDKYQIRPDHPLLNDLCLWEFAALYVTVSQSSSDNVDVISSTSDDLPKMITLKDNKTTMRRYQKPAIPRYHVFSVNKDSEKFYHQQLMLFIPWQNEEELALSDSELPYEDMYNMKYGTLLQTKARLEHHSDLVDEALRNYDENGPPQHAWDLLNPEAEQQRVDDARMIEEEEIRQANAVEVSRRPVTLSVTTKPNALKDEQLKKIIHGLNSVQRSIFTNIISWCKDTVATKIGDTTPPPFHIFVTGGAGTGKSQFIKAMYHQASKILQQPGDNPDYPVILLTSPTGTAAYNIGGTTLHAALHLPRGRYYSLRSNPSLMSTFKLNMSQLKILVIDEISMVGRSMLAHIHRRLQEAKGNNSLFGGVSILAVGDFFQLPPVRQQKLFDYEVTNLDSIDSEELAVVLAGLWEKNFTMVELHEIMRQREDNSFAEMLNRLRTAEQTNDDISTLKSRIITPDDTSYPHDALHIYATRKDVEQHNTIMLNKQSESKIVIKSITKVPKVVRKFEVTEPVGGLSYSLTMCVNARIMLIKNLDIADGLVNGATGKVIDIIWSQESATMPKAIIVQFDNKNIGRVVRQSSKLNLQNYENGIPILPVEVKQNIGRAETSPEITRIQYPLVLCWACTIHKVQGATLEKVVISFKKIQTKGQAYVALSRARSLQGLFLLDLKPEAIKVDDKVSEEMKRMREQSNPDIINFFSVPPGIIRLCFFNVQSLGPAHRKDVDNDPYITTAHVLALSETWHCNDNIPQLDCYENTLGKGRQTEHGGGVALYSKTDVVLDSIDIPEYNGIDLVAALMTFPTSCITIAVLIMYCPPRTSTKEIYSCVKDFIYNHREQTMIIGGDLNINLQDCNCGSAVVQLLNEENFNQVSSGPTHHSGSHIDHVWTNLIPLPTSFGIWTYYSDHKQIFVDILI